jgi:hypothetical protein
MKPFLKITFLAIFLIGGTALMTGVYLFNKTHADLTTMKPDFTITAAALQKEFETDESAASAKYISKVIEVTGPVASLAPGDHENLSISIGTGNPMSAIICTLAKPDDPSKYREGQEITVRGECSGFLMDVLLNNCAVVKK